MPDENFSHKDISGLEGLLPNPFLGYEEVARWEMLQDRTQLNHSNLEIPDEKRAEHEVDVSFEQARQRLQSPRTEQ